MVVVVVGGAAAGGQLAAVQNTPKSTLMLELRPTYTHVTVVFSSNLNFKRRGKVEKTEFV